MCLVWELARDFWGPRWASQSHIAEIAAISVREAISGSGVFFCPVQGHVVFRSQKTIAIANICQTQHVIAIYSCAITLKQWRDCQSHSKRGRKIGAARKLSKSAGKYF